MSAIRTAPLRKLLANHRRQVATLAGASLLGGFGEAVFLVVLTRAAFAITADKDTIGILAGRRLSVEATLSLALALVVFRVGMALIANWYMARLNSEVTHSMRIRLAQSFLRSTWTAQQASRAGQLQELITSYTNSASALVSSFSNGVIAGFSMAAMLLLAAAVDPVGSLVAIGALATLAVALRPIRKRLHAAARRAADDGMRLAIVTSEISDLGMVAHVFDVRGQVERSVTDVLAQGARSNRRLWVLRGLVPAIYSGLAFMALVGAVGLASVWDTASLTSLGAVMLVMLRSLGYGQQLQLCYTGIAAAAPQVEDVFGEIDRYTANVFVDTGDAVTDVTPIRLEEVHFHYEPNAPVLLGISVEIESREMVGIVGPSGSGKSTLVQLLLGLRDPVHGRVVAAGRDIRSLRHADWARRVTFVPQSPALVHGSISDNIRFYRQGISNSDIERAAKLAGLHDEIVGFSDGYEHQVGDRGSSLSGGQQQRLCIARALVLEPELLILDEPTSSLDAKSEMLIRDTLDVLRQRMTVVVIAHRLSTLDACDRIMVLQHGVVAAFDRPAVLKQSANFYAEAVQLSGLV